VPRMFVLNYIFSIRCDQKISCMLILTDKEFASYMSNVSIYVPFAASNCESVE
jgi:hypothetical protein